MRAVRTASLPQTPVSNLRILHLEDDELDALLVRHTLEHSGLDVDVVRASSREEFQAAIDGARIDAILTDHRLPGFSSMQALAMAKTRCPNVPVLVLSGASDDEQVAAALSAGAAGFLTKDQLPQMVALLRRLLTAPADLKVRPTDNEDAP
jgi:sigma-B regulation protein RsbU (phosphoserine phosphatase)